MRARIKRFHRRLGKALGPAIAAPRGVEILRAGFGGALALLLLGWAAVVSGTALVLPLGASAVLIIAVPNSPLAQPWSVVVGNGVSALAGWIAGALIADPVFAPALGFALALPLMLASRALHPPGGAMAAIVALEGAGETGLLLTLLPILLQSVGLVIAGILWNSVTGRVYPFRQPPPPGRDTQPATRFAGDPERLRAILAQFRQSTNIGVADLARIIAAAESDAAAARFGGLTVGEVMSHDLITLGPGDSAQTLAAMVQAHGFTSFPVVEGSRFIGIVTQEDLIRGVMERGRRGLTVGDLLEGESPSLPPSAPVARLLPLLSDGAVAAVPVLEGDRLVGIVTRSDLLALLAHELALQPTA